MGIANRYEIVFSEIGTDQDPVPFLVPSVPTYSPKKIVQTIQRIPARKILERVPSVNAQLCGGAFWASGYYIDTGGRHASEEVIRRYVPSQGTDRAYRKLHERQ